MSASEPNKKHRTRGPPNQILRDYPYLEAEDIAEALSYAAWRAEEGDDSTARAVNRGR